ncbi:unnamed protein product [Ostreobium quekettii]|uniref:Gamma-interferon-inducible lysosomal thiol reductase n=1 Tax=Ostreobium quekettii TaxID=121088 RepID=A0A8S1IL27_9CHLO|nr:unnamed protein product [Ostreobium quekettii]|eukprot:evm.model.scf_70EXC.9 EVM.evm.TU.scf_70EXC.9   scf_70EXC:151655-153424(+)
MAFKLLALLLLGLCAAAADASKTKVTLYDEALCPFCRKYVSEVLAPLFENGLSDYIDLRIVALGNARKDEEGELVCQHGPVECIGNRILDCAMDLHPGQDNWFPLVLCLEDSGDFGNRTAVEECAWRSGVDAGSILECAEGPRGKELVEAAYNETWSLVPEHRWVPWVVVNDLPLFDAGDYVQAAVCLMLPEDNRPDACYVDPFPDMVLSDITPVQPRAVSQETVIV